MIPTNCRPEPELVAMLSSVQKYDAGSYQEKVISLRSVSQEAACVVSRWSLVVTMCDHVVMWSPESSRGERKVCFLISLKKSFLDPHLYGIRKGFKKCN